MNPGNTKEVHASAGASEGSGPERKVLSGRTSWTSPATAASLSGGHLRRKLSWNVGGGGSSESGVNGAGLSAGLSSRRSLIGGFLGFLSGASSSSASSSSATNLYANANANANASASASGNANALSVAAVAPPASITSSVETAIKNTNGETPATESPFSQSVRGPLSPKAPAVSAVSKTSATTSTSAIFASYSVTKVIASELDQSTEPSPALTVPAKTEPELHPSKRRKEFHSIAWSVSSELGYRNMLSASAHPTASNLVQTDFIRIPIHTQIEDIHWPAKEDKAMWAVNGLGGDHRVFGHHYNDGGVVTSEYDHTWEKDVCGASSTSKAMEAGTDEDFAAVSGQFDVISESGSFMSSSDDGDDGEDDNNQRRKQNAEDLMELVRDESSARFVSVSDPMAVESSDGPTSLNMNTSATPTSSDTESTLSSTNNSSSLQRDDHSAVRLQGQTGRKIPTTEGSRLFILADGHGGILASKFFVPRTKAVLSDLLLSQLWDFSLEQHRADFETRAADAFRVIDAEYCATQVARYRTWVDNGSVPSDRPDDDGCALVAVVLHNGWLVNLNVGDSRMTLASRLRRTSAFQKHQESWHPVFTSVDHNMTHPAKVYSIFQAGGHFMSPNHSLIPMNPQHPSIRKDLPYHELANARIYRHASAAVKAVGVSHRRTLNLTGTMGDLLFKIEPAILNPIPDVSFVELEAEHEYVMFLATDGIWDHLMDQAGDTERQNSMVLRVVAAAIESVEDERDANLKEWEMYREAKVVWRRGEAERRKRVKAQKKEAKRVFALEAPVAASGSGSVGKDEDIVIDDNLIGGHGAQGDVAVAAEDDFGMSPIAPNHPSLALGLAVSSLSASSSGLNGLEDDSASEAVGDSASIASSNGSTAVASKERSLDKKNEGHDDEAPTEEGSPSSKQSLRGLDEDVQFDDALEGEDVASSHLLLVSEKDSTSDSQVQDGGMNTFTTQKFAAIPPPTKPAYFDFHEVLEARLRQVTDVFAEREMGKSAEGRIHPTILKNMSNLYWQKQIRYDDATAFVAFLN